MTTATRTLMTAAEFEPVAAGLGPCELVRGEVVPLSSAGVPHDYITTNVTYLLCNWARRTRLGRVVSGEAGLIVARDPDTVRGMDVAYCSYERSPRGVRRTGFRTVPPNLVVEVLGQGQGWREMVEKVGEYLRMGVDRIWVVDPDSENVHIYRPDAEPRILCKTDTIADEIVLPGFSCRVEEFFED